MDGALFRFREGRMVLEEIAPEVTLEQRKEHTKADFEVAEPLAPMKGLEVENNG